jgi:hypothetical protein
MKKILLATAILAVSLSLIACTDAERAGWGALGDKADVKCYSGAQIIYEAESTGKVIQESGGGIDFRNAKNGKFVRAFADCIVETE